MSETILLGPFVVGIRLRLEAIKFSALILLDSGFGEIVLPAAELRRLARISVISERFSTESMLRESIERVGFFAGGAVEDVKHARIGFSGFSGDVPLPLPLSRSIDLSSLLETASPSETASTFRKFSTFSWWLRISSMLMDSGVWDLEFSVGSGD